MDQVFLEVKGLFFFFEILNNPDVSYKRVIIRITMNELGCVCVCVFESVLIIGNIETVALIKFRIERRLIVAS